VRKPERKRLAVECPIDGQYCSLLDCIDPPAECGQMVINSKFTGDERKKRLRSLVQTRALRTLIDCPEPR